MDPRPWSATTVLLFAVLVLVWGMNYLFVNLGLTGSGALWLASLRAGIGLVGTVGLVTLARGWGEFDRRDQRDALLLGIPNTAVFFGLWFVAAHSVAPGIASVVVYTFPLWVALFSAPVLGSPLGLRAWLSLAIGFGGVALIAQFWSLGGPGVSLLPIGELAAAAISWAIGTVLFQRRFRTRKVLPACVYQLAGGFAVLLAASIVLTPTQLPHATVDVVAAALWLGLAGTTVGYSIWFTLLDRTPAAQISAYLFLVPVVALVASAVILGERLSFLQGAGVALVLVAIYGIGRARLTPSSPPDPPAPSSVTPLQPDPAVSVDPGGS
ncbi:MAG: DMT family transporter [Thermoplasmata archaeon]